MYLIQQAEPFQMDCLCEIPCMYHVLAVKTCMCLLWQCINISNARIRLKFMSLFFGFLQVLQKQVIPETIDEFIVCLEKENSLFLCAVCQAHIKKRTNVRKHIKNVHLKQRNHTCSYCAAAFATKNDRTRHEKICKKKPKWITS